MSYVVVALISYEAGHYLKWMDDIPEDMVTQAFTKNRKEIESWIVAHHTFTKLKDVKKELCQAREFADPPLPERPALYWDAFATHYLESGDLPKIMQKHISFEGLSTESLLEQMHMEFVTYDFYNSADGARSVNNTAVDKTYYAELKQLVDDFDKIAGDGK